MSLAHIRLTQTRQDIQTAEYTVESSDFCSPPQWQAIGMLVLHKAVKGYEFRPAAIWIENKAIPPEVYASEEAERTRLFAFKYRGWGWGEWARFIHGYASQFLTNERYPEKHPPSFFSE